MPLRLNAQMNVLWFELCRARCQAGNAGCRRQLLKAERVFWGRPTHEKETTGEKQNSPNRGIPHTVFSLKRRWVWVRTCSKFAFQLCEAIFSRAVLTGDSCRPGPRMFPPRPAPGAGFEPGCPDCGDEVSPFPGDSCWRGPSPSSRCQHKRTTRHHRWFSHPVYTVPLHAASLLPS